MSTRSEQREAARALRIDHERLRVDFEREHAGLDACGRPMVLPDDSWKAELVSVGSGNLPEAIAGLADAVSRLAGALETRE